MNKISKILFTIIGLFILLFLVVDYINDNSPKYNDYNGNVEVYFIDVGEAESILINNKGSYMLIDGGNNKDGKVLVKYLKSLGINKFDYVIGTHAHEDHIGGLDYVIKEFDVEKFYMPLTVVPTLSYEDVVKALNKKNIKYNVPYEGEILNMNDMKFEVLSVKDNIDDLNNSSIVMKMTYKDFKFLFMADVESPIEEELLSSGVDVEADVLKVAHHGTRYASTDKFLSAVNPKYAVIMCGNNNDYGHPHKQALNRLKNRHIPIYRTDLDGTIIFKINKEGITVDTVKTNTNVEDK